METDCMIRITGMSHVAELELIVRNPLAHGNGLHIARWFLDHVGRLSQGSCSTYNIVD